MDAIPVSSALLRSLARPSINLADEAAAWECGARQTKPAARGPSALPGAAKAVARRFHRKWQRSPDRAKSVERRRTLAATGHLPPRIRALFTEGERAVMMVIGASVKAAGACEWPLDKIAAVAGVCRTTAQNAIRKASGAGVLTCRRRPVAGRKNLPNLIRIAAADWMAWVKRGPGAVALIGFKLFRPTVSAERKGAATPSAAPSAERRGWQDGSGMRVRRHGSRTAPPVSAKSGEEFAI